jgi:TP901 family phage tail tape measure protein
MAGNIGDLQVNLSANTSQMERDVSSALKRLESKGFNFGAGINAKAFTQPLGRITGASNEFQKSLDASNARVIAFGASAGAIYTIQKAFTSLISSTIEVQKSLTDINVILGASQKTLGQFGDKLFEIAKNSGQAFSTVATAAGELARQGLTVEQTLKRTSDALVLARLSGLDAASSVEALTASINSFNSAALDSSQIVNKLAAVDAAFAVSSGDLAEALKRVGSSAQDVGVSFDELLAIVASVNQTTARGGAVIGNSLKTIFTRVQRTEVLDQLEALGVAVRDLNGNTAPAIQVLTGLASKFDELGSAQKSQVAELVGGVFQINILKAALGDLSKQYSVYGNALKISQGATDEATRRNEELNKTLSALLNRTLANLTKVGSDIGSLSFAPAIEKVLGGINTALESFDIKGDSIGGKIGKGIFEGIGSFVSGPGLALLIGVFLKIFGNLAKFTTDAVRTVLGLNKEAQAQAQIQERINNILAQNPQLIQNILNKQVSLLQVEKDILTVIQAQSQARQQSTAIATSLTRGLISKGVTSEKGVITAKTKSQGFIPNFSANREVMGAIAGGYMPGNVRSMNIPNYGRVTYNDAETVKQFSGLSQPGIMPPANSDAGKAYKEKFQNKYGIDPYASSGFIPNFAARPATQAQNAQMLNQGYVRVAGNELKNFITGAGGILDPDIAKQYGIQQKYGQYYVPESKYNKLVYGSKGALEKTALRKGQLFGGGIKDYALVYPGFTQDISFPTFGTTKGGKQVGYYAVPFPGQLKSKKNSLVGPGLYGGAINALVDSSSSFLTGLAGVSPSVVNTSKFKRYLKSNITQDQVGSLVGNLFEGGILAALEIAPTDRTRGLDLNSKELQLLGKTFKMPFLQNSDYLGGDFKNSLSLDNRNSMAEKIATNMGTNKALGFIPNFSPLDKALSTEGKMGGRGVLDFKPGLGLYVRDGKTQPNFAAVMRDHPEGIGNAVQNSKKMQSMMSGGFIPNFAGFDPMSLFLMMQSMGGAGGGEGTESKLERSKLASILRERRATQQILAQAEKQEVKDQGMINDLKNQERQLLSQENAQRTTMNSQMGVFARDRGGKIVGGVGGALGRFGSRYGAGLALAAPLLADTASQFIGNENTAGGRATKAGISGLGTTASYAGLGFTVGGPIGAAVGGGIGGIMAAYDVFEKLNDIMPDVAKSIETSTEKFNNISAATQTLSVSLETLSSIEGRADLDAKTRLDLRNKSETEFAKSITQLNAALPGAGDEIVNLYKKIGDTAELRQKISEVQVKAQRESKGLAAGGGLLGTTQKINDLAGEKFYDFFTSDYMKSPQEKIKGMSQRDQMSYRGYVQTGGQQLSDLFSNFSKTGEAVGSVDIGKLQAAYQSGGINGIKNLVDGLVSTGAYSQLIGEELKKVDEKGLLDEYLKAWKEHQESVEKYREALAAENAAFTQGTRSITDIQALQRQFSLPGGISSAALGNIDYSKLEQNLSVGKSQAFGEQVTTGYKQLSDELGYGADRIKYLSEYVQKAAEIQKDFNNGAITTSQAFERLKLSIDKIEFGKNSQYMFSDERASARQGLMERSLKQGNFKEGFDPLTSFFDKFGDNAATTADKINKSFANLASNLQTGFEDAFGAFVDGTKTADQAFQDMLLSISQQIIKEQFSIGMRSLLGGLTGGGGFGEQGGGGGGLLGNILGSLFGGKSQGGIIKKYSSGGHVQGGSGMKDDVPAMLTDGEYVLRKSAVNKYGKGMLDMLNQGGMVKGYAGGGSVNALLNNSYDFFGANGEKLTQNYTPEAFKTTVNAPSELGNVPALTGKFNISDMLSSRALMDENNPMNALRTQRFLGMQSYQEQVSNFKTGYNEQYRQVEEQRKEAQRQADEINKQRMDQYNRSRSNMLIGGLLNVGMSLAGPLLGGLGGGGGLGGLFGGGGGGGGLGGIFGGILNTGAGLLQTALTGGFSQFSSMPGGAIVGNKLTDDQKKAISDSIERGQFGGYGDPFSKQQAQLFPQFGSQGGFGGGMGGNNFGPTSSIGGFQFGVGLGAPAGFQTQTQNAQRDYLMNFASPVAPVAPGRGNLVYDFLNQNSNPFGYNTGYAKGGLVRGYYGGGMPDPYLPASVLNLRVKGSDGNTYTLAQMGLTTNSTYADLQKKAGQGFGGGYNNPEVIQTLNSLQSIPGFQRVTAVNDLYHQENKKNSLHTAGLKGDFTFENQNQLNKQQKQMIVNQLKEQGLTLGKDYKLNFESTTGTAPHFDFELKKSGITKVAAMNMGIPAGNIAGTNTPAVMAGFGLPSKESFPLTSFSPSTNQIAKRIDTIGPQAVPDFGAKMSVASKSPIMYSMIPDINRNQSTFSKEVGKGILAGGAAGYGLKKIIESNLGQEGLMSTLRSAYGGTFKSSLLPSRNYGSNFVKPATAIDKMFLPLNTPPKIMPKQLIAPNEMADILKYAKSPAMGPAGEFSKLMPKQLVAPGEAKGIMSAFNRMNMQEIIKSATMIGAKGLIVSDLLFNPSTGGPTENSGLSYEIEMGYRNLSGQLTPLGERVLGPDNVSVSSQTAQPAQQAVTQQDFLGINQQSPDQILPFFKNLQDIADQASGNAPTLYQSVGSLYDVKNKGDYSSLASKFSSFYGNDLKNRYSSFGEKGFNSYLNYIGANPFSSLSQLNSFKFPMTPGMYSPFAFGSQNFGGFGGTGYQSGFNSLGNVFSNWFSTGSRLGITPSWASRATGGMIYGGTSTKDDVPAMLMGGEYVVRKDAVDRFGQPFFDRLNRGQVTGFAEGGPVGTALPSVGGGGANQQDNSRNQFVESITKLVKSLEQLNKGIEEQNRGTKAQAEGGANTSDSTGASGVTNNISINVNVDQNGKTTDSTKQEDQSSGTKEETDQEKFKKTMERSRVLAELLRQQVLKVIVEEQRPGGVLYQGSKGRDMGR